MSPALATPAPAVPESVTSADTPATSTPVVADTVAAPLRDHSPIPAPEEAPSMPAPADPEETPRKSSKARPSVPPKRRLEQVRLNHKKSKNRRDVNDKFATLPKLGGMAAPDLPTFRNFNNSFSEAAASLPTFEDVSSCSRSEMLRCRSTFHYTKYIFKSGCPTPDPQWPSEQQLMIGPIPADVEYSNVRSAFHNHGPIFRLFIPSNISEIIGGKRVKFGYIVYADPKVVKRLLVSGFVIVGGNLVPVKKMDGKPVINDWRSTGKSS